MSDYSIAVNYVLSNEGEGFVNNPLDPGGATKLGISLRFLKSLTSEFLKGIGILSEPTEEDIKNLNYNQVASILKHIFWDEGHYDQISNQSLCNYIFDMAVNMSPAVAIKITQRSLWAFFNIKRPLDDGILGQTTLNSLNHSGILLMPPLRATRMGYYRMLVEGNHSLKCFLDGWINRCLMI